MKLKTIPLFALSFGVLSGCTNSCQSNTPATPAAEQSAAPEASDAPATSEQAAPAADEVAADETSASDTLASAETSNE